MNPSVISSSPKAGPDLADISVALISGLSLALTALFMFVVPFSGNMAGSRDFVAYWATGQQLVHHANPYDSTRMMQIEHGVGLDVKAVLLMRNPPWGLPLAIPLGFLGVRVASVFWSLLLLGCLFLSVHLLWVMNGRPKGHLQWLGLSFTPALICLIMGQTSLFALLGLVLFLRLHKVRPFWAGISLWLCFLKPHLFLPFFAVLVVWTLYTRSYSIFAGAAVALAASCVAATMLNVHVWHDYFQLMHAPATENEFIPCLSDFIRLRLRKDLVWLQYLPTCLGSAWAVTYYWRRRDAWSWLSSAPLVLLVSLVVAPYCWIYDQGLAIPAIFRGVYGSRSRAPIIMIAGLSLLLDVELCRLKITSALYLWPAVAWLAWYLWARSLRVTDGADTL